MNPHDKLHYLLPVFNTGRVSLQDLKNILFSEVYKPNATVLNRNLNIRAMRA